MCRVSVDHASPSDLALRSVEVLNLQHDAAPESRVSMSMTLQEYQRLMQLPAAELAAARSLGRDEGATAMEGVVQRLTEHMGKMYQEGQGLQNQCAQLKTDFLAEMDKTAGWYKEQLQETKKTGDAWASDYKADLDREFSTKEKS